MSESTEESTSRKIAACIISAILAIYGCISLINLYSAFIAMQNYVITMSQFGGHMMLFILTGLPALLLGMIGLFG